MLKLFKFLLLLPFFASAESYLCTSEKEVGIQYEQSSKKWVGGIFKGNQFILKPIDSDNYGVFETTKGKLIFECEYWFPDPGVAHCGNNSSYFFKFSRTSKTTGNFVYTDLGVEYLLNEKTATPFVGLGKCIKI